MGRTSTCPFKCPPACACRCSIGRGGGGGVRTATTGRLIIAVASGKVATAHERNECGSPHWPHDHRSRHPEPVGIHKSPASIVERRKSPRLIFHPGPAPAAQKDPVTVAIWSPAHDDGAWPPARAVARHIAPVAVVVEIFITGHFARNVVRRVGMIFTVVAIEGPAIEIVAAGDLSEIVV